MKIFKFPSLRQSFDYDCGATAMLAVLGYYGIDAKLNDVMQIAQTKKEGTEFEGLIRVAKHYGLKATKKKMEIEDVRKYIDKKIPVILSIQAWPETGSDLKFDWKNGHYVVAIGYDKDRFYFQDPSTFYRTYIRINDLLERWHDCDVHNRKFYNVGIAIFGKRPADLTEIVDLIPAEKDYVKYIKKQRKKDSLSYINKEFMCQK